MPLTHTTIPTGDRPAWSLTALTFAALLSACATTSSDPVKTVSQRLPANPVDTSVASLKLNIQSDWQKLLPSPQTVSFIELTFAAHPSVDSAQRALLAARQSDVLRAGYFNSSVIVSDTHNGRSKLILLQERANPAKADSADAAYYGLHTGQLTVTYLPEALHISAISLPGSEAEMKRLQLDATYRTLTDNLIACTVQEASLRAQMSIARKIAAIEQSLLAISRKRLKTGSVTQEYVNAMEASAERSEQVLSIIKKQFGQTRELLRLLLGIPLETELPDTLDLSSLRLAQEFPLETSASLAEQRPDMRAVQSKMLPADVPYQNILNAAMKDTENSLSAIYRDALAFKAATASEQENRFALEAVRQRYAANAADYQDVLAAEQNLQLVALRLTQTRTQQIGDAVTLYHALGGAWWNGTSRLAADSNRQTPH